MSEGWICPRCGRGLAPWVSECPCYQTQTVSSNYGTFRFGNGATGKCAMVCSNKTDFGYCRTTGCINPKYGGDPNYGIGNGA